MDNAGASLPSVFWGRRGDIVSSGMPIRVQDIAIFCKHEVAGTIDVYDSIHIYHSVEGIRISPGVFHWGDGGWKGVVTLVLYFFQMVDELPQTEG